MRCSSHLPARTSMVGTGGEKQCWLRFTAEGMCTANG